MYGYTIWHRRNQELTVPISVQTFSTFANSKRSVLDEERNEKNLILRDILKKLAGSTSKVV